MVTHTAHGERRRGGEPIQQRGRDRRLALLRAALELLADGGMKAVTHRAVAARAGMPLASTTYYFASIDNLTEEAMRLAVEERVALLKPFTNPDAALGRNPDELARAYLGAIAARPRADILAQLTVLLESARNPALHDVAIGAIESFEVLAQRALALVGPRDATDIAIAISALLDGFALHRVVRPLPTDYEMEVMLKALWALFLAHTASDAEFAEWRVRLAQGFRQTVSRTASPGVAVEPMPSG